MLIKMRKIKSRTWRHARKRNAPEREQKLLKRRYELQKRATSIYLGKRKGEWEKEKVIKARTNSKILWNFTRDILGSGIHIYRWRKKGHRSSMEDIYRSMEKRDIPEKKRGCLLSSGMAQKIN